MPTPPSPLLQHRAVADRLLFLQRSIGNAQAVTQLIGRTNEQDSPVRDAIASPGVSLDHETRARMEQHLDADLSDVRLHVDANSTESVQASAYTVGSDVVVHPDRFSPGTAEADHTLAHELTQVVQQRRGAVDGTPRPGGISVSDPNDRFEREAERSAQAFSSRSLKQRGNVNG